MGIIKFPKILEKIKREEYLCVTRLYLWHARSLRDHELSQDRAIKPANTGKSFNFLVRILGGWAGQSLPFKSPHLCIFTAWLADKFKNKRKQAFPPEKHSPWNDEWQAQQKQVLFVVFSFFSIFWRGIRVYCGQVRRAFAYWWVLRCLVIELERAKLAEWRKTVREMAADCNHLLTVWPSWVLGECCPLLCWLTASPLSQNINGPKCSLGSVNLTVSISQGKWNRMTVYS